MHLGLIGGIGVAATVVYYQRLTAAVERMGGELDLTIVHGDIQTLIQNNRDDNREAQAREYAHLLDRLHAAGCDCAAITSLGGHFCFDETRAIAPLPLISAVSPLDRAFAERGIKRVGLLGVRGVMQSRLYGQLRETEGVALEDEIETLGQAYQDMAVAGHCSDESRALFLAAGARMVEDMGAQVILLAGTDLNLAFDGQDTGYPVVDALDFHVDLLARLATGRLPLDAAL